MLILWPEIAILRDVLQHVSLDGHSRSYKRPPRISGSALPDLCCWCVLDLFSECLPTKQTPARARFRTAGLSPCVCSCPAMPRSRTDGMRNSFRFIFRRDPAFVKILLPTLDQLDPSSRIAFPLSSGLAYCISRVKNVFPSFLFSKVIRSFCPSGKYSRQPCQWHPWNWSTVFVSNQKPSTRYPAIILFPPWPHILIDMKTHPPGLELHPAYRHSRMCPLSIKRFFIRHFGNLDLLSSAHHLDCPSRTSLCIPPQVACFGESFFDTRHTHSGSTLCRDSLSGKRDLRRCWILLLLKTLAASSRVCRVL